jgi:hypothetical protein
MHEKWTLGPPSRELPELVISIIGALKGHMTMPFTIKKLFENDLKSIIRRNKNTWLITSGTDSGVMKLVGEIVGKTSERTLIGIASYGFCHKVSY